MNNFEEQLQKLFPDLFALHLLIKDKDQGGGGEKHLWDLIYELLSANKDLLTGSIMIGYSQGKINSIQTKKDVLAFKKQIDTQTDKPV